MANERLYQFPSKSSPVPADIVYVGDSASSFDEVNCTIAQIISAYPNLSGIGALTLGANTYIYSNNSSVLTAGSITALAISLLADSTISTMQTTLGYTSTPTASLFAGWDANKNLSANNFLPAYTTIVTAAGTTTLTVSSTYEQFFTGTTTQTVLLPVTSTLVLGQQFYIVNNSTGVVTVQSSGGNTVQTLASGTTVVVTCILISGTTAASWNGDYNFQTALSLPLSVLNGGTGSSSVVSAPAATAWAGWDANKNLSANNFLPAYTTIVTAAGTTTLTVSSTYEQFFTGTTTQTVLLPVTSTLVLGQQFYIVNNSTGVVTVQSSGGNTVQTLASGTTVVVTCILISGTTAASWNADYSFNGGGSGIVNTGTQYQLSYYANNGNAVSGLATANNGILVTDSSGIPSISSTVPSFTTGTITFNPTTGGLVGTTTNDNASAGKVGELISSVIVAGSATNIANTTPTNLTSISLTAGDWDVWGNIYFIPTVAFSIIQAWINTVSATVADLSVVAQLSFTSAVMGGGNGIVVPQQRLSLASTTTIYISGQVVFSAGTATQCGGIYARRRR